MKSFITEFKHLSVRFLKGLKYVFNWKKCVAFDEYKHVESVRDESNITRMFLCIFLLFIFEIFNFISILFAGRHQMYRTGYLFSSVFLTVVAIVYLILALCHVSKKGVSKKGVPKKTKTLYRSFWFFVSAGILFFSTLDILERSSLINYVIFLSAISLLPILDLKEISALLLSSLIYQWIFIMYSGSSPELYLQSVLFSFAVFLIAQALFITFIKSNLAHKKLEFISETDALTGLLNRRGLETRLESLMRKNPTDTNCIAIAVLDVDHFKMYNDRFGHLEGDNCLKKIADCLKHVIDEKTNIICRFGGEEFVLLIQNIADPELLETLLKIKRGVKQTKLESGSQAPSPYITVSIGACILTDFQTFEFKELFCRADKELYHAKQNGRDIISLDGVLFS